MIAASAVIFATALAVVALERLDRTKTALAGATLVVLIGALSLEGAVEAVDWPTLGLLVGMMIVVGITERTGIFLFLALWSARLSGGRPLPLVLLLAGVTAVLSALLDNLTAILLVVPIALRLASLLRISPVPLVVVEIVAANIGGAATLIGDPPNIMIGSNVPELGFVDFAANLAPVALVALVVTTLILYWAFRRRLASDVDRAAALAGLDPFQEVRGKPYVGRCVVVLLGTIVGFFLQAVLGIEPAVVALTGATALLLVTGDEVEKALERVEWPTIFFFVGLFVMVGALEETGGISKVTELIADLTDGSRTGEVMVILGGAALGSAIVDNIPFTAAMIPVVDELEAGSTFDDARWWALALGAAFGGNTTVIAAAANVAATGILEHHGHELTFGRFLLYGVPVTLASLGIAAAYLLLFQL